MSSIIFYGVGQNVRKNFDHWVEKGLKPICFADADIEKHHTACKNFGENIEILPLLEAVSRYPDYILYCTQNANNVFAVKDYLLGVGVPENRIKILDKPHYTAQNALAQYSVMLCDSFKDIINKLIKLGQYRRFKPEMLANDVFQVFQLFITQQPKIQGVYDRLDNDSQKIWYYLIYLWLVTQLFLDDPEEIHYSRKKRYNDFKIIQSIVSGVWDLESTETEAIMENHYIISENFMKKADYVIDAGAYTGDTAEIFSQIALEGAVFAFEPYEASYSKLQQRHLLNVQCINKGLYSMEGVLQFTVHDNEPGGNSVSYTRYANKVEQITVTTIDKFVLDNRIERIDFIKMDIEGSELFALQGGYETIRRFKPNMAICIYHNYGSDCINVPIYLVESFGDIYEFSIKHHSVGWYESVMYAVRK